MAKNLSVISGKGGTGKSTTAAALSMSLASLGYSVLAVDMDIGLRALDLFLGMENQVVFDIGDVISGNCRPDGALTGHPQYPSLKLLCAPSSVPKGFQISDVIRLLERISRNFDYMLIDSPAGIGLSIILTKSLAQLALVVATPDILTLRDARKTTDVLFENCKKPSRLIINKVSHDTLIAGGVKDLDEAIDIVGIPLLAAIPEDPYINQLSPDLKKRERRNPLTQSVFDAAARRIAGEYVPLLLHSV